MTHVLRDAAVRRLLVTMAAFAVAAGANTTSVALERRAHVLTRRFGRGGWYVHLGVVVPLWLGVLGLLPGLGRHRRWALPRGLRPLGLLSLGGAALLWLAAFRQLGATRTGNGDVFGHVPPRRLRGGVFRLLRNPMYDSYALALVGVALHSGKGAYLAVAGESLLLLNGLEARVEAATLRDGQTEGDD